MNALNKALAIKKGAETKLQGVGRTIAGKVKGAIDRRMEIQKNYENRTAKGDYYKSAVHFK